MTSSSSAVTSNLASTGERKVCLWPTDNGTGTCGKTFTKFDSLKRHLAEAHKGVRPFACTVCDKTYGRKDYLQRHLKSHNSNYAENLAGGNNVNTNTGVAIAPMTPKVIKKVLPKQQPQQQQQQQQTANVVLQANANPLSQTGGRTIQIVQTNPNPTTVQTRSLSPRSPSPPPPSQQSQSGPSPLSFLSITGQLPTAKPMGSKICRWVQNDGTVCGKAFSKLDSLRRHVNELHKGVRPHTCNLCDKSYGRRDYLDRHMRTHQKKKMKLESAVDWGPNSGVLLSGDDEDLGPPAIKVVKKKRKDIPPEEKKICLWILEDGTACGKTFTKFDSLKRHVSESHKGIRPYACSLCGKDYGRRDYLLRHLKSHNEIEVGNIQIQKVKNNPSNHPANMTLNVNEENNEDSDSPPPSPGTNSQSTGAGQNILPAINFGTVAPNPQVVTPTSPIRLMKSGMKRRLLEDKKTCKWVQEDGTVCGKTFSKFDSLRRHVAELHKNIRPFVCDICNKSYGRKDYLDRHMKSHSEENKLNPICIEQTEAGDTMTTTVVVDTGLDTDDDDDDLDDDEIGEEDEVLPNVVTVVSNNQS